MRIWSKDLIPYLPKKQLMAMRYELGDMIKQYPNIKNGLVKFANKYDISYLGQYFGVVILEFERKNINHNKDYDDKILKIAYEKTIYDDLYIIENNLIFKEDNDRYLKQCLYNLQEKADRGIITKEEWKIIEDRFKEYLGDDK